MLEIKVVIQYQAITDFGKFVLMLDSLSIKNTCFGFQVRTRVTATLNSHTPTPALHRYTHTDQLFPVNEADGVLVPAQLLFSPLISPLYTVPELCPAF